MQAPQIIQLNPQLMATVSTDPRIVATMPDEALTTFADTLRTALLLAQDRNLQNLGITLTQTSIDSSDLRTAITHTVANIEKTEWHLLRAICDGVMNKRLQKIYDVTVPLTPRTILFPGDPTFEVDPVTSLAKGDTYNLNLLRFGNHTGTHVDFPAHVISDGASSEKYPIEQFIGDAVVLDLTTESGAITDVHLRPFEEELHPDVTVLFKTRNSSLWDLGYFVDHFVALEASAAAYLRDRKVRMVGIDYISVDTVHAEDLPVHHLLLGSGILLIEGLNLSSVLAGRYRLYCLPLNIPNMDGLPVRAILEEMS